ncbi:hypothetical protein Tco_0490859, partial [Tanacetum coccineum]
RVAEGPVTQTIITHNATYQADDLDTYDSNCDDFSTTKAILMANLSSYGSDILSEYLLETQNAAVQDINSSAQQDAMILYVFEQLSDQFVDYEKEINYLKQTLSEQSKEKELLTKTFNVFKNESKEKEAKNIDKEIALEKKVKELDNIVYKMGQSTQTMHMLTKPQVFYDNNLKQALRFQNPFYLKKAQQIRPILYDGSVIAKETIMISIADSEETLMFEEESQSKMLLKQSDLKVLEKKVNIKPINYAELNRLSKDFGKRFWDVKIKSIIDLKEMYDSCLDNRNRTFLTGEVGTSVVGNGKPRVASIMHKKAQQIRPMLYDGSVIAKETNVISIADSEETLMLEEESRSKMLLRQNLFHNKNCMMKKLSVLQASHPKTGPITSSPVKNGALGTSKKAWLIKALKNLKFILAIATWWMVKQGTTLDALSEGE